jgi:ATP-binding cassette subfamily F protein 3
LSLLIATNLSQSLGSTDVFEGLSVAVPHEAKIGLIGANGIGKTTLLRVLAGAERPSYGQVQLAQGKHIGYLHQEAVEAFAATNNTLFDEMQAAFANVFAIERRLREIEHLFETDTTPNEAMLDEYGHLQEEFTRLGGYEIEQRIHRALTGLGFGQAAWQTRTSHLSGGQKTRALLAKLLLEQPDVLILDEPTNHLDIEAIEWLEGMLKSWSGAFIISSHDRYFLDRVVGTIWEMSRPVNGKVRLEIYRGNYSAYVVQRQQRFEREVFLFDQQKEHLEHELVTIKRDLDFLKGQNGDKSVTWVKGKLKRLTRDVMVIEQLGVMAAESQQWMQLAEQLEGSTHPWGYEEAVWHVRGLRRPTLPEMISMTLAPNNRGSDQVIKTSKLAIGYASTQGTTKVLFECDELRLMRGARVALIGPNGAGKTTFVRSILGDVPPLRGQIELGASVRVGYFAQTHDEIDTSQRIIDELLRHWPSMNEEQSRHYLSQYLFRGDDIYKYIRGLSGGEKARLALAILTLQGANCLVLDEPTNHLDIWAQEVLQTALASFDGTILLVSHDRYLINALANQVWEIRGERLEVYRGNYAELMAWREVKKASKAAAVEARKPMPAPSIAQSPPAIAPAISKNAAQKQAKQLAELEKNIAATEAKLHDLAAKLDQQSSNLSPAKVIELSTSYADTQVLLERLLGEWEGLAN